MSGPNEVRRWQTSLDAALARAPDALKRAVVLEEVGSTQDAARRLGAVPGEVVIALRQTGGRGRMHRPWADTRGQGVAMTLVTSRGRSERLAILAAVIAHHAVAAACCKDSRVTVGLKWPNDVMVGRRKVAGCLVEQFDDVALVGIGINVGQVEWPDELQGRAASLRQLGIETSCLAVALDVVAAAQVCMIMPDSSLAERFLRHDLLRGSDATFQSGDERLTGRVEEVDPLRGLTVLGPGGRRWLPAATTTVIDWRPAVEELDDAPRGSQNPGA